jgi:hypothetical protein
MERSYRPDAGRSVRIAWTCALPGLVAFSKRTLASWAATAEEPTTHWR